MSAVGRDARSAESLFLQPALIESPARCWYCRVVEDRAKLEVVGEGRYRCIDTRACVKLDAERFAKCFGDAPAIMAARERGIANAHAFIGAGAADIALRARDASRLPASEVSA
jgi:hypothetical protein